MVCINVLKKRILVKLNVRDKESIQEAVRRFPKLVERSGIKKEMRRRRECYEKPSGWRKAGLDCVPSDETRRVVRVGL